MGGVLGEVLASAAPYNPRPAIGMMYRFFVYQGRDEFGSILSSATDTCSHFRETKQVFSLLKINYM